MNAGKSRRQVKVLLVDDHAILRQGVHALLAREPDLLVVGEAGDGEEALAAVARLKPDVVIMDIVMPRMNGLEATRLIKERHPDTRVLILSVSTTTSMWCRSSRRGRRATSSSAW